MARKTRQDEQSEAEKLSPEIIEYFQKICDNNPLDYLSEMMAPHLVGQEWKRIRKAGLLTLVTGSDMNQRNRVHMLLVGKPGTGKTEYMLWWRENLQGILINAELCSKTGLVGDASGSYVVPGLLADFDRNIVLVDELDKMGMDDQNGLLQAMEEGQYIIVKGTHREPFKAEIRIIGSVNEIDRIQKPLLDRFDFVYNCTTATRKERADQLGKIVDSFMGQGDIQYAKYIRGYLRWLGNFNPIILPENRDIVINTIATYLIKVEEVKVEEISYRSLECSILRIAWAMAKLKKKNITRDEVTEAIIFKNEILRRLYGINVKE